MKAARKLRTITVRRPARAARPFDFDITDALGPEDNPPEAVFDRSSGPFTNHPHLFGPDEET